ncbi:MAG: hypothetical protein GF330_12670 [Candidatus Eisenbacteria bacterium]|nr:hypothetical protein [Candidatus Eisenbacteria bacterium]
MKALTLLGLLSLLSLTPALAQVDIEADHERAERAAAMRARAADAEAQRLAAEPATTLEMPRPQFSAEEARLVAAVRAAKQIGDPAAMRSAEEALAAHRGATAELLSGPVPRTELPLQVAVGGEDGAQDRWLPHEFLVAGEDYRECRPALASDAAGTLYAAFEAGAEGEDRSCLVYKSTDGGERWQEIFSVYGVDLISPSIAIGEGYENWLFVAFNAIELQTIYVLRINLDDPATWDMTEILENAPGVSNPRIVTDSAEYPGWYAYLVFNAMGVDNWVLLHTRTRDYGASWEATDAIAGYCGYPGEFYDATYAHPDIAFGSGNLHVAFDNYPSPCSTTSRDIFFMTSTDYGASWGTADQLTSDPDDEHDPAIGAVKNSAAVPTVVVAYTRFWDELDEDVWYRATQDGILWSGARCISCTTEWEKMVNLVTSRSEGMVHAGFWSEFNVDYAGAAFDDPLTWAREDSISTLNTVADIECRPGMLVDPTQATSEEVGIAWTDFRYEGHNDYDIYYDAGALPHPPDDFYLYLTWDPGHGAVCGVDGFVDELGQIEGLPGAHYVFFVAGAVYEGDLTGYIYRVETDGDPDTHPDNPHNTGPVAPRTFTFVSSHYMGYYASNHDNAFYVDETGIYYGPSNNARGDAPGWADYMGCAIYHWDFDWDPIGCEVPDPAPGGNQTLARNDRTGDWWATTGNRRVFRWDGASWVHDFTHPQLGGGHHDGMEIINGSLFISDMTSDVIIQYRLDDSGDLIDPPNLPSNTFFYSATPSVEGLGYDPNHHIWISGCGAGLYEIGGGALQLAFEGIPDQCVLPGDAFTPFDLDDYVTGVAPFSWSWEGNVDLTVEIDAGNVVTITYPPGWIGQETITFTVEDGLGTLASDDATFTVSEHPVVGDIPDQTAPFTPIPLDDYLSGAQPEMVRWTASGMSCLVVEIDPETHVATVTDPGGCPDPEEITFTATVPPCGGAWSDADAAIFDPGFSSVADGELPAGEIAAAAPNPSRAPLGIHYTIHRRIELEGLDLVVHDISGRVVRTLLRPGEAPASRNLVWDGCDEAGQPLPSGTYFFRLRWDGKQRVTQVMLVR